ncbi:putative quinol monooxygenase [Nocardiopsis ansamitocini]|uniref:ABM domain-containing protein n=1 Tax=Nocardiopsis ansamitocini TaxID=1670832 RepID=A0A9W6P8X3_9ACTN|nr:antibiotic biosynthesis monooxygenase [Nocardiopsis ansamitocini]GLU49197.1 hypothetical protein Nans01_35480 [Nocardiopsis ansamitocini]
MVEVGLAFICALVAWSAAAALSTRTYRKPELFAGVWTAAVLILAIALSAAFPGALLGFSPLTFRLFQIGVSLLGPLLLAWGAVEYVVRSPRALFGVRLVVTTLGIVPLAVLTLDPLRGRYGNGYPAAADHYAAIPMSAIALVDVFALIALLACAIVAGRRLGEQPRQAKHQFVVLSLIALSVLLLVLVGRMGLGLLGQVILLGAIAAVWVALIRATAPHRERSSRRRGGRRTREQDEDEEGFDDYDDDFDDDYDDYDEPDEKEQPVRRKRRGADYDDEPVAPSRPSPRLCGVITIYTLANGHADAFDDDADEVVEEVRRHEPDTLFFACHTVPSAPLQRIVYAIYRDELALEEHEQQPHVADFARRRTPHVVATNVIELSLSGASATDGLVDMLMPR